MSRFTIEAAETVLREHWGFDKLRPSQEAALTHIAEGKDVLVVLATSSGKCLGAGTPVLMFDGTVRAVEDVRNGDLVMGPDSKPRRVQGTCKGRGKLFRVTPVKGDSYIVNEHHVLSLKTTPKGGPYPSQQGGRVVNVSVHEWGNASKTFRHTHKGWRTGVEFQSTPLDPDLPPYMLGLWLGDGSLSRPEISKPDAEVRRYVASYAGERGMKMRVVGGDTYAITNPDASRGCKGGSNQFTNALRRAGVYARKHIPLNYRTASRQDRLEVLAGLLDTDGHLNKGCFDYISKDVALADDLAFLCRSLGLAAYVSLCEKSCQTGYRGVYYRVCVSGDLSIIPTRLPRRRAGKRLHKKNVCVTGLRVEPLGVGDYYGFVVDRDSLFLLGDFTVTHNSAIFQIPALLAEGTMLVVSPLIALMKDQCDNAAKAGIPASFINSHIDEDEAAERMNNLRSGAYKLLYISPERLAGERFRNALLSVDLSYVAVDEAHMVSTAGHSYRPSYRLIAKTINYLVSAGRPRPQIIAVTATATADIEQDIAAGLGLREGWVRIVADPIRPNLTYEVVRVGDEGWDHIKRIATQWNLQDGRYIVYCSSRKGSELVRDCIAEAIGSCTHGEGTHGLPWKERREAFKRIGIRYVAAYHAGMHKDDSLELVGGRQVLIPGRNTVQRQFTSGEKPIVVATCAFGMGIDVPNIRHVVHFGIPGSLENLTQEAGRAGRDGKPSRTTVLADDFSAKLHKRFIDNENPPYDLYAPVWSWLSIACPPGTVLSKSLQEIALLVSRRGQDITMDQAGAIMTALEAAGLVRRTPAASGVELSINVPKLREVSRTASATTEGMVAGKLLEGLGGLDAGDIQTTADKDALAEELGRAVGTISAALNRLAEKRAVTISPVFRGKTTEVLMETFGCDLADHLPRSQIEKKRECALRRLQAMLDYTICADRIQYIRDYFSRGG